MKTYPIFENDGKYHTTTDMILAHLNNYIGEIPILPKKISNGVLKALYGQKLKSFTVFYYGDPDERLKKLFGYEG